MTEPNGERILFSSAAIAERVDSLAAEIMAAPQRPEIAVPILAGAFVFAADLLRALARSGLDLPVEFIWLRAYGDEEVPVAIEVIHGPSATVRGKAVLLIDGVLDSGATLTRARELLASRGAASVISVVLVSKAHPARGFDADYRGFEAGREFLYGYGMDKAGKGRALPDIRVADE
jgi:hypoxanthine phosphoribosyltransferase